MSSSSNSSSATSTTLLGPTRKEMWYGNELSTNQCRLVLLWDEHGISHKEQKQIYGDEQGDALPTKNMIFQFITHSCPSPILSILLILQYIQLSSFSYSISSSTPSKILNHIDLSSNLFLVSRTASPLALDITIFIISIDTTLYFIKIDSVFDLQNENLCNHYENTRPVTSISLFGWPFLDLESSSYRPFIAIISILPSSLPSHRAKNQQSPFGKHENTAFCQHRLCCFKCHLSLSIPCLIDHCRLIKFLSVPMCSSMFQKAFEEAVKDIGIVSWSSREVFIEYKFFLNFSFAFSFFSLSFHCICNLFFVAYFLFHSICFFVS